MSITPFSYVTGQVPAGYQCSECGAATCKLWRPYSTFLNHLELLCARCSFDDQKKSGSVDSIGFWTYEDSRTDQIGWLVPAVPTQEGDTFWVYGSVPWRGVVWWQGLPSYPQASAC